MFYKTTYLKNNKYYYGSHHGYENDNYRGSNKIIKNIQKRSGNLLLKRDVLRTFKTKIEMLKFEDRFLKLWNLKNNRNCYNFKNTAIGGDTWSHQSKEEQRIRKDKLIKRISGPGNANYGKPMPQSRKDKMIKTKTGVPVHTEESKRLISTSLKKEWACGKRTIPESFKAASNNRLGCKLSEAHKLKLRELHVTNAENYKRGTELGIATRTSKTKELLRSVKIDLENGFSKIDICKKYNIKFPTYYLWKNKIKKWKI